MKDSPMVCMSASCCIVLIIPCYLLHCRRYSLDPIKSAFSLYYDGTANAYRRKYVCSPFCLANVVVLGYISYRQSPCYS